MVAAAGLRGEGVRSGAEPASDEGLSGGGGASEEADHIGRGAWVKTRHGREDS